jgi:hypothetical protein
VDGLTPQELILYDNNVPQAIRMDWMTYPIDLVAAVETSSNSGAVVGKLGGSGILFTQLLAARNLFGFSHGFPTRVRLLFTNIPHRGFPWPPNEERLIAISTLPSASLHRALRR